MSTAHYWTENLHTTSISMDSIVEWQSGLPGLKLLALQAGLEQPLPSLCYDFGNYLAYLFYPPLYIAGPLLSFKSFASQLRSPKRAAQSKVILNVVRQLCMMTCCASSKLLKAWRRMAAPLKQVPMFSLANLGL